jgi:hypothetical protein
LQRLRGQLEVLLGAEADRAQDALAVLISVTRVRNAQQHSDSAGEADRQALGLHRFASDWAGAWEYLRVKVVGAVDTIREELSLSLDAPD